MKNDQDTRVAKYQEYQSKGMSLYSLLGETFAFYEPEFMAITDEQYKAFVSEVPALEQYGHYFDRLLERKRTCLVSKEELLAGAGEIFAAGGETFEILDNAEILFSQLYMMTRVKKFN